MSTFQNRAYELDGESMNTDTNYNEYVSDPIVILLMKIDEIQPELVSNDHIDQINKALMGCIKNIQDKLPMANVDDDAKTRIMAVVTENCAKIINTLRNIVNEKTREGESYEKHLDEIHQARDAIEELIEP